MNPVAIWGQVGKWADGGQVLEVYISLYSDDKTPARR